ncbi:MAG: RluA family pseudouridine synthase [Vicinamibacterales bacterium]
MPASAIRLEVGPDDAGARLDQFVTAHAPSLSRSQVQRLIREGRVTLSRGRPKPGLVVEPGLVVDVIVPAPVPATPEPEALPLTLLHDDADVAVVIKPAGMVVHPGAGHARGTLVNALLHHVGALSGVGGAERPGLVHRLDRGTSGVLVIAKHDRAHRHLSAQFQDRTVDKEYLALVWGTPSEGEEFDRAIGRDPRHRQKMSSRARRARPARTRVAAVEPLGGVSLVRLAIATGRTHQIRVHLSEQHHPVVGDALYGGVRRRLPARFAAIAKLDRPFLHAARLAFDHPSTGERMTFDAPLPDDLDAIVASLRRTAPGRRED